jgi:hypothetical protein
LLPNTGHPNVIQISPYPKQTSSNPAIQTKVVFRSFLFKSIQAIPAH